MTNEEYGQRLRDLRGELGLSLREVEERGGPSKDVLSPIERGMHKPRTQTLGKIAHAFGMSVSGLRARLEAGPPSAYPPVLTLSDEELDKLKKDGGYDEVSNLLHQLTEWFSEHSPGPMTDAQRQEWERTHPGADRYLARAAQIIIPLSKRRTELEQASHSVDDELEQMEEYAGEIAHK